MKIRARRVFYALLAWTLCLGACSRRQPPENLLLVSIDTLRADHVSAYGYERPTTPNIDAFAAESVLFENAYSHTASTVPSFSSIMTSKYPHHHGVTETYLFALSPDETTLAEHFQAAGFDTTAILGIGILMPNRRLDQGFETYAVAPTGPNENWWSASEVTDRAISWLDKADSPFFLWVHYFEPHQPYKIVPEEFLGRFASSPDPQALERWRDQPARHRNRRAMIDRYDGAVAYVDSQVGRLLGRVDELGLRDRTMVVLTADHGEALAEHGLHGHIWQLYEPLVRVPLVVRLPGIRPSRVVQSVEHVDILPTVLQQFGLPMAASLDGEPLPLEPRADAQRDVFAETWVRDVGRRTMIRSGRWKLILSDPEFEEDARPSVRSPQRELYDLETDPAELTNLAGREPERTAELEERLRLWMTDYTAKPQPLSLRSGELEMLRSLGYVGEETDPSVPEQP